LLVLCADSPPTISKHARCFNLNLRACPRAATLSLDVGNVYAFDSCNCGCECRYSKQPVATVCAPDDISAPCCTLEAQVTANLSRMKSVSAVRGAGPGLLCTLRRRCNANDHVAVPALALASWPGAKKIARSRASQRASATTLVATQSRQNTRRRALPQQRSAARRRNFALDLPLVAYPTQAEYEQYTCCSGARRW
jgi:hypothetical protein